MQASGYSSRSDTELASRAAAGDEHAFAALYERHFEGIYDFVLRTVRDPELTAYIICEAFIRAWDKSHKRRPRDHVKAWLYATVRERAVRACRRGGFVGDASGPSGWADSAAFAHPETPDADSDEPDPQDAEVAAAVWTSVAQLSPKQYSLLDFHLRRGLTVDELAETLGLTTANVYIILYRLRGALADAVCVPLLSHQSRCLELNALMADTRLAPGSADYRRVILKHLETCARCQATKAALPSALEAFANLAPLTPPIGLQASIWSDLSAHINGLFPYRTPRTPEPRDRLRGRSLPFRANVPVPAVLGAGIVSIGAILVAGILIFGTGGGGAATARDPSDVHSTNHTLGEPSSTNTIDLAWTAIPGAKAYSTLWSHLPEDLPDTVADLPGTATSTTSPP